MSHDLLVDPAKTVYAVNCTPVDGYLHCGALHAEPGNPFALVRLAHNAAIFDVELPPELIGSRQAISLWNVSLPLAPSPHD